MPQQDYDFSDLDVTSFYQEKVNHKGIDYVPVNLKSGDIALVPVSLFETQEKEQVITEINWLHYRTDLLENCLKPEQISQTAEKLRNDDELLNSIAHRVSLDFQRLYEQYLENYLETKPKKLPPEMASFNRIVDKKGNLKSIKLNIDENKIYQLREQIKKEFLIGAEKVKIWEQVAENLLSDHSIAAVKRMEENLGIESLVNMSSDERLKAFQQYCNIEQSTVLSIKLSSVLQGFVRHLVKCLVNSLNFPNFNFEDLEYVLDLKRDNSDEPEPVTESRLTNAVLPVPSFAAFASAITAQIRKDLWGKNNNGIAYFKHQAKGNPKNYIEHYISNPGDIELLPWEQAEQIVDKFGFNTVKLHLIFAAHTMNQPIPWSGKFSLKGSDVVKYLGWDKRTDLLAHQKLNEIAKAAFVLDCLLVKSVWVEGRNKKGEINASTPTGRMWNVVVDPRGQLDTEGKVEKPEEVYITVQPGLIFHSFLNKAGSKLREALYQFGYIAQDILRIDPYHQEMALRLAIHLVMDSRVHISGKYRVETLLKNLLPYTVIDLARIDKRKGYDLKQRWDNALKLLLKLRWQIEFDNSYPEWLQPGSKAKKPSDARKMKIIEWLLQAKITIHPPEPIPDLLAAKTQPKPKAKKQIPATATRLTSDQIRKARNAKGWSQRKLAGWLGVTQALVGYWEKGKRTPSEEMEKKLRQLLEIFD